MEKNKKDKKLYSNINAVSIRKSYKPYITPLILAFCLFIISLLIIFPLSDAGWVEVKSVTMNGRTYMPSFSMTYTNIEEISEIEYNQSLINTRYPFRIPNNGTGTYSSTTDYNKSNLPKNGDLIYTYLSYYNQEYKCYKAVVENLVYNPVKVKVEKDKISINTIDGTIETYTNEGKVVKTYTSENKLESIKTDFYTVEYFV